MWGSSISLRNAQTAPLLFLSCLFNKYLHIYDGSHCRLATRLVGPWVTSLVCADWHSSRWVSVAHLCHAPEGRFVGAMAVSRSLSVFLLPLSTIWWQAWLCVSMACLCCSVEDRLAAIFLHLMAWQNTGPCLPSPTRSFLGLICVGSVS